MMTMRLNVRREYMWGKSVNFAATIITSLFIMPLDLLRRHTLGPICHLELASELPENIHFSLLCTILNIEFTVVNDVSFQLEGKQVTPPV